MSYNYKMSITQVTFTKKATFTRKTVNYMNNLINGVKIL